jgi:hypothetical protein
MLRPVMLMLTEEAGLAMVLLSFLLTDLTLVTASDSIFGVVSVCGAVPFK